MAKFKGTCSARLTTLRWWMWAPVPAPGPPLQARLLAKSDYALESGIASSQRLTAATKSARLRA